MDTKQRRRRAPASEKRKRPASNTPAEQRRRSSEASGSERAVQRRRSSAASGSDRSEQRRKSRAAAKPNHTERRRRTGAASNPDRAERQRRTTQRRNTTMQNPPARRRVVRPPREEIPAVIYTAPKPIRKGSLALRLASMAAVVAAVFFALSVFFRVETITVAGAEKYTPWMVRQAAGVEPGDPLLSIGEARVASRVISKLPYVDEVKVGIRLPGTVEIQITELQVTYSIEDESGSWWLISADGRAVEEIAAEKASGYTRVEGLAIQKPRKGSQVQALPGQIVDPEEGTTETQEQSEADEQLRALISVMSALENNRIIGQIALIDVTDAADIRLEYPQLLTVRLGDADRMDYKVSYLAAAAQKLENSQSGELDLTLEYVEDAIFTPSR